MRPGGPTMFGTGPEYTVGVEEELMLLDAETLALVPDAASLVEGAHDLLHIKPEIRQSMVEIASDPHDDVVSLGADLARLRAEVAMLASAHGHLVAGGGTHPFSRAEDQAVSAGPRYHYVMAEGGWAAWRASTVFGTHVHVAMGSADKSIGVTEAILGDLPTLLAVSASSPCWEGVDTGLASTRLAVWSALPRTGLPPAYASFAAFERSLAVLCDSGVVPDASHLWWDVRSQARLGTIEVRIMDGQPDVADTTALAGLVQCLVHHHGRRWDAGERVVPDRLVVAENRWLALRRGMTACFAGPDGRAVRAADALDRLLEDLDADAEVLGARAALERVAELGRQGGPVTALRRAMQRRGDPVDVVREQVRLGGTPELAPGTT